MTTIEMEPKGIVWGPKAKPKTDWTWIVIGGFVLLLIGSCAS